MCAKAGHRKSDCWWTDGNSAKSPSRSKDRGKGKPSTGFGNGGTTGHEKGDSASEFEEIVEVVSLVHVGDCFSRICEQIVEVSHFTIG